MPLADIVQMVQFLLDHERRAASNGSDGTHGLITVAQLKGGVGGSSIACALAAVWARHGLSVALVDLDDVNPQVTSWGRVPTAKRKIVSDFLQGGEVPPFRVSELLHPLDAYSRRLSVVGQPERYQESFHFKADVLDSIPSSAEFIASLVQSLRDEFDVIVVDSGRSWGIATFALLPESQKVVLVTDDRSMSLQSTIENLTRLYRESDDGDEFDFVRWRVVMNSFAGNSLSPKKVLAELEALDMFPRSTGLSVIPRSREGREWALTERTLFELGDPETRDALIELAFSLVPFKRSADGSAAVVNKLRKQFGRFMGLES
jgi:cellulose biosynthesis protein BcsQ